MNTRYLLNPYLLLPSLALSTSSLENAAIVATVAFACERAAFSVFRDDTLISCLRPRFCEHSSAGDTNAFVIIKLPIRAPYIPPVDIFSGV
jgi:hypothetical protein